MAIKNMVASVLTRLKNQSKEEGIGLIMTKLEETSRSSIALSIISMNLDCLLRLSLFPKLILIFSRFNYFYEVAV